MIPSQWFGYTVACCASVFRLNSLNAYFVAFGTTPSSWPSAHVSQPLTANQLPPTYTAWLSPTPRFWPRLVSWTPGSSAAGDCEEPIRVGPPGAPMPVRKRLMFWTSSAAWEGDGAPARIAHGCGSPKMTPRPSCIGPE